MRKLLPILCLLFTVPTVSVVTCKAQITMIDTAMAKSTDGQNAYSRSMTTTASTKLIVVGVSCVVSGMTIKDSKGNTYNQIGSPATNSGNVVMWECINPTGMGSSITFTCTPSSANRKPSMFISIWSGVKTTSPQDQNGNNTTGTNVTSQATNSMTPAQNGELYITTLCNYTRGVSTISGLTLIGSAAYDGNTLGGGMAYQIQTTATATSFTWSWSGTINPSNVGVLYKAAPVSTGNSKFFLLMGSNQKYKHEEHLYRCIVDSNEFE